MTETYHVPTESTKEEDEETDKKGYKKRAAKARLGEHSSHDHAHSDRPHKLGGEVLRPLAVELPKRAEPERSPKQDDDRKEKEPIAREAASLVPDTATGVVAGSDELKKLHDEVVASVSAEDDDLDTSKTSVGFPELDPDKNTEAVMPTLPEVSTPDGLPDSGRPEATPRPVGEAMPSAVLVQNQTPNELLVEETSGNAGLPLPLVATERFVWGDSNNNPWEQPAGGLANPKVLERLDKIDAREQLNDAYHSSRETGLASVVGIIGLGLILEHFAAKRRDKRLKRKIDAQERQLKKTNQAAQLEQQATQLSIRRIERVDAANAAKSNHAHTMTSAKQAAEVAVAAITAAAEHGRVPLSSMQERVLAERLMKSKTLGRAIKQNPELKGIKAVPELRRMLAATQETVAGQERQIDELQREVRYEQLQGKQVGNRRGSIVGDDVVAYGMPVLPSPAQQLPAGVQADLRLDENALIAKKGTSLSRVVVPVTAVIVLLILAAVLAIVFTKG